MATISLGKIAFSWKNIYSSATAYVINDVVNYNGTSYICIAACTNIVPTNTSYWNVFAQGATSIATTAGDLVYHNGSSLVRLPKGSTNQVLSIDSSGVPIWSNTGSRSNQKAIALFNNDCGYTNTYRRGGIVMEGGTLRAWGRGENYLLGSGDTSDRSYPIVVGFPAGTASMTKFYMHHDAHSASIDSTGKLWLWGANSNGEAGTGNTTTQQVPYCASTNSSNSIYGKTVTKYAPCGGTNENSTSSLVLCSDGTVHSTGYNGYGQLGNNGTTNRSNFAVVSFGAGVVITDIVRGRNNATHCLALSSTGKVYAWGYNSSGQLGIGNTTQQNTPVQVSALNSVVITKIFANSEISGAIDSNGNLYTWGLNNYGQLGWNGTTNATSPTSVALTAVSSWTILGGANDYACSYAIKTNGNVYATGYNGYGNLGVAADTTNRSSFTLCKQSDGVTALSNITKVVVGGTGSYDYVIALDSSGVAWSCGYSGNGQLGRGTWAGNNYWFSPVYIHRRQVVDITTVGVSSEGGTLFLLDDGQVYQTGYAGEAQLPEDDNESISIPMPVIL